MVVYGGSLSFVRNTLATRLGARAGLSGVQVSATPPLTPPDVMAQNGVGEAVWVDNMVEGVSRVAALGASLSSSMRWEEKYTLKVCCQVLPTVANPSYAQGVAADDRAAQLMGEVMDEIARTPDYSFANWKVWVEPEGFKAHLGAMKPSNYWAAQYEAHLLVQAINA